MIDFNGKMVSDHTPVFLANNRGFNYGDGFFETFRVVKGHIAFWDLHYNRLLKTMQILRMNLPPFFEKQALQKRIIQLVDAENLTNQSVRVKINVYRETGGLYTPSSANIGYIMSCRKLSAAEFGFKTSDYKVGCYNQSKVTPDILSTLKTSNKLINVLASLHAKENGWDNSLLLNDKNRVVEATNANIFWIENNTLKTPPLAEGCLDGVIRKVLLEFQHTWKVSEEALAINTLLNAEEVFLTNSIVGLQPVTHLQERNFTDFKKSKQVLDLLNILSLKI